MNPFDVLERAARSFPDRDAVRFEDSDRRRTLSYRELRRLAIGCGDTLSQCGVRRGDHIAVFLPNIPEYPAITYGSLRLGAVPVLLSSALRREKVLEKVLEQVCRANARILVTSDDLYAETDLARAAGSLTETFVVGETRQGAKGFPAAGAAEAPPCVDLDSADPALILYTSGTTGEQKDAVLSHGNVLSNIEATARYTGMRTDDRMMCFLPLFHCFGQDFVMNATFFAGGTLVLHRRFVLDEILESLRRNRITMFFSIPPNYRALLGLADISPFDTVRYFFSAADTIAPEIVEEWKQKFRRQIWQAWGLTETSPLATYNHEAAYRRGSVGTPIAEVEVRIADEAGEWLGPGETGQVAVLGPNVFQGYFGDPQATRLALRDGWFFTGDVGKLDTDGYLYIVDRSNDRIKVSGFSVWPREIEKFLLNHFGSRIKDVGVIGIADRQHGEAPFAYVVPGDSPPTAAEILEACRHGLTGYQKPVGIEFVPEIPKTSTGKILKRELRRWPRLPGGAIVTEESSWKDTSR